MSETESADVSQLNAELVELRGTIAALNQERTISYMRHRPLLAGAGRGAKVETVPVADDATLAERIIDAYRMALNTPTGSADSFWLGEYAELRRPEHDLLLGSDLAAVQAMLRDPLSNNLFYGFDTLARKNDTSGEAWVTLQGQLCYDSLLRIAEAVGMIALEYPEAPLRTQTPSVEVLLSGLDHVFGFRIEFPNFFRGEVGLETSRGVATYRAIQSLYQAWCIAQVARDGKALEIGGGLGRTAYYANNFGVNDYTIIDLPLTGVAQAYFLQRNGLDVQLYRETREARMRIMPPSVFFETNDRYDIIVNVDSFPEMAPETMRGYFEEASRRTGRLLSINHEYNQHRIYDLIRHHASVAHATREPYWLRRGYVHEMITFKSQQTT